MAGVFAHARIAHAVDSVLNRVSVAHAGIKEFVIAGFGLGATAHIVGDFCFGELLGFEEGEVDGGALEGNEGGRFLAGSAWRRRSGASPRLTGLRARV